MNRLAYCRRAAGTFALLITVKDMIEKSKENSQQIYNERRLKRVYNT